MSCHHGRPSRRELLARASTGFGALAFGALFGRPARALGRGTEAPLAARAPMFRARARSVIYLYMDGGPSQVDTFDHKPLLERYDGQDPREVIGELEKTQFDDVGQVLRSPWDFQRYGESGLEVSDLFQHVGEHADKLCLLRSMTSKFPEHTSANYFLHTGTGLQGRPSTGAWVTYGLGSENQNLPGYVVINGGLIPSGGIDNFNSGFLPATYQGSLFYAEDPALSNIVAREKVAGLQAAKRNLVSALDRAALERGGPQDAVESAIANAELAARMQAAVPELMEIDGESAATRELYGLDDEYEHTRSYGLQCLLARRMVERGVRFVELTCPRIGGADRWDAHGGLLSNHTNNARAVDKPIAGLLADLECRGLLDQTLVIWSGEFGRTPFAQGRDGRDHNQFGFSLWLAGGGVRGGMTHGATDEWGYRAVENVLEIHDLHATILHLLGIDHERLTYRFSGRDIRLTDVYGHVIHEILA